MVCHVGLGASLFVVCRKLFSSSPFYSKHHNVFTQKRIKDELASLNPLLHHVDRGCGDDPVGTGRRI